MRIIPILPIFISATRPRLDTFDAAAFAELFESSEALATVRPDTDFDQGKISILKAELSPKRPNPSHSVPVASVGYENSKVPMVGITLGADGVHPVLLSTVEIATCTGGQVRFMNLDTRRVYSDMERACGVFRDHARQVSLAGSVEWREDVSRPIRGARPNEVEIGSLDASPRSAMMAALHGFSIEIDAEGNYQNLLTSPSPNADFEYLPAVKENSFSFMANLIESRRLSLISVDGNKRRVEVVLDTASNTPAILYGMQLTEGATTSVEMLGRRFPLENVSSNKHLKSTPTLVINPSILRGMTLHFDGQNNRVGFKESQGSSTGCIIA